jgi:hypothetical protein
MTELTRLPSVVRFLLALGVAIFTCSLRAQVNVTTSMYNNQRTGVNSSELVLTPANVNSTSFGKLFELPPEFRLPSQYG